MPRKNLGAIAIVLTLAVLICALSALPAPTAASAEQLAQPSERPPLFTPTAAAPVASPPPPEATREPPPTVATIVPFPTTAQPRVTRTSTATPSATPITIIIVVTATPGPVTPTDSPTASPTATFTSMPPSPTSALPTAYAPPATAYPAASGTTSVAGQGGLLLWMVVLIPFLALALALWWLFVRRFPLYPAWGRPRRGSRKAGRDYVRRRSFPF